MNQVITILLVHFAGYHIEATYDSRSDCGAALLELATTDLPYTHAQCVPTGAPSVSLIPMVRP
jgi:hypothetical protein